MFHLKKYRGVIFDCNQDWYKFWRNTVLCFQKLTWVIWQIFTRALESLQIGTLMASFCLKLKIYELLLDRGVVCYGNEELCKVWRGIDLSVQNWPEEFDKFWPKHSKISRKCTFNRLLLIKVNTISAKKSIEELFLTALNIDSKFDRKTTCAFKNGTRNLANFDQSLFGSLKIGALIRSFYPKYKIYELRIYRGVLRHEKEEWSKLWT